MLSRNVNSGRKAERADLPMSLAHLNDSIGYELPHAIAHIRKALKATSPAIQKRNLQHAAGHTKDAMSHNKKLTRKLNMIPSVKRVMLEVSRDSKAAGGPS